MPLIQGKSQEAFKRKQEYEKIKNNTRNNNIDLFLQNQMGKI